MQDKKKDGRLRIALFSFQHSVVNEIHNAVSRELLLLPGSRVAHFHIIKERRELEAWKPDGILAHIHSQEILDYVISLGLPVVNTSAVLENLPLPTVSPDNREGGRLAAEYLLRQGYTRFAFAGNLTLAFARQRLQGFREGLGAAGQEISIFSAASPQPKWIEREEKQRVDNSFEDWLDALPPLCGIFTAEENTAVAILDLLRLQGKDPATTFGVLSGHDRNSPTQPPLTAVGISTDRWGKEAARLLLCLIQEKKKKAPDLFFPPLGIIERDSCSLVATQHPLIRAAIQYIRDHADVDLLVTDVADALGQNRRNLDRVFHSELETTVLDEIQRAHVEQAKRLLLHSTATVADVAAKSGISDVNRLFRLFKKWEGMTPAAYRNLHQGV